jgi:hypothetical protein
LTSKKIPLALALILLAGLGLRLAHWRAVAEEPFFAHLVMDSYEYDRWARTIAAGDWLGSEVFFQAPLYPYVLGATYALFGRSLASSISSRSPRLAGLRPSRAGRTIPASAKGSRRPACRALRPFSTTSRLSGISAISLFFLLWALARPGRRAVRALARGRRLCGATVLSARTCSRRLVPGFRPGPARPAALPVGLASFSPARSSSSPRDDPQRAGGRAFPRRSRVEQLISAHPKPTDVSAHRPRKDAGVQRKAGPGG